MPGIIPEELAVQGRQIGNKAGQEQQTKESPVLPWPILWLSGVRGFS
jgi:hypothetical protein